MRYKEVHISNSVDQTIQLAPYSPTKVNSSASLTIDVEEDTSKANLEELIREHQRWLADLCDEQVARQIEELREDS